MSWHAELGIDRTLKFGLRAEGFVFYEARGEETP